MGGEEQNLQTCGYIEKEKITSCDSIEPRFIYSRGYIFNSCVIWRAWYNSYQLGKVPS